MPRDCHISLKGLGFRGNIPSKHLIRGPTKILLESLDATGFKKGARQGFPGLCRTSIKAQEGFR